MKLGDFEKIFHSYYTVSNDVDSAINMLKKEGATIMMVVKVVKRELKISLREADNLVVNSSAFKENKEDIMDFRDVFWEVVETDSGVPPQK